MKITINGEKKNISAGNSLKTVIAKSCRNPRHTIAELNGEIIKKDSWEKRILRDGDSLELVNFVGGG